MFHWALDDVRDDDDLEERNSRFIYLTRVDDGLVLSLLSSNTIISQRRFLSLIRNKQVDLISAKCLLPAALPSSLLDSGFINISFS